MRAPVDRDAAQADQRALRIGMVSAQECAALRADHLPVSLLLSDAYRDVCPLCERLICRCVARSELAWQDRDDCEQATWERLMIGWSHRQFDPGRGTPEAWVRGMARHAADDIRRQHRRDREHSSAVGIQERPAGPWPDLLAAAEARGESERLARWIEVLHARVPESDWLLFHGIVIEQRPVREVARALGITAQRASDRCRRLKEQLRRILAHNT